MYFLLFIWEIKNYVIFNNKLCLIFFNEFFSLFDKKIIITNYEKCIIAILFKDNYRALESLTTLVFTNVIAYLLNRG